MKLLRAKVENYRSILDTDWFEIEPTKTILVGPNEAGKTAVLKALEALNPPGGSSNFVPLRDFPRAKYSDIQQKKLDPDAIVVVKAVFELDDAIKAKLQELGAFFSEVSQVEVGRRLNNRRYVSFLGLSDGMSWSDIQRPLARIKLAIKTGGAPEEHLTKLDTITATFQPYSSIQSDRAKNILAWLNESAAYVPDQDVKAFNDLQVLVNKSEVMQQARNLVADSMPTFVYYANYYRVRPRIHLRQLAERISTNSVDEDYDFGNMRLLDLLGLSAAELAQQGDVERPEAQNFEAQASVQDRLDDRMYRLNAATVELTKTVRTVWGDEDADLDIRVDGDYLKVVARDDLGVEVELDQRSEGFQWLVSFYIVFKAQSASALKGAILLLDEPGVSLHALKQQEFRRTVSLLADENQTIYTTHSPFMVGPDELPLVRVVEMKGREAGTKVHSQFTAEDPAALFPLQAALGYSLSQSLFAQPKNLVLEGMTDYWYIQSISDAFKDEGLPNLDQSIALVPAGAASRVVYFAVLLQAQKLKVAALLDTDSAGDTAAEQDNLVGLLTAKRIHRTKDYYNGLVKQPEIEDLLRDSLLKVANSELGLNAIAKAATQPTRPIVQILKTQGSSFSKDRLARRFIRWLATNGVAALTLQEREAFTKLFAGINSSLK